MSEAIIPVSALGGAKFAGYATVTETGPVGMITLRCDLAEPRLGPALAALGLSLPGQRRIVVAGDRGAGWVSPDELLLILPYAEVGATLAALEAALSGLHHLAVDVSDARAVFRVSGTGAREVLAKLCPVDLSPEVFTAGELRRTRAAQVAAAIWLGEDEVFTLISFRSVAGYVMGILSASAAPGSEVGLF